MRTTRTVIGMLLRYARERCKISRKEFCRRTGLDYKVLWDIESGHRHISLKKLNEYIAVLGITEDEFWDMGCACLRKERKDRKKQVKESMYEDNLMDASHKN